MQINGNVRVVGWGVKPSALAGSIDHCGSVRRDQEQEHDQERGGTQGVSGASGRQAACKHWSKCMSQASGLPSGTGFGSVRFVHPEGNYPIGIYPLRIYRKTDMAA